MCDKISLLGRLKNVHTFALVIGLVYPRPVYTHIYIIYIYILIFITPTIYVYRCNWICASTLQINRLPAEKTAKGPALAAVSQYLRPYGK